MSLGYTAMNKLVEFKPREKEEAKRHFKFQAENYEISVCLSVCLDLSVSQCVSLFLDNMRLIYK